MKNITPLIIFLIDKIATFEIQNIPKRLKKIVILVVTARINESMKQFREFHVKNF